jgi:hypothetical protein
MVARLLVVAVCSLMLLAPAANAQSNMCYPTPGKRSKLKKGACFMVSHTTEAFFGDDVVSAQAEQKAKGAKYHFGCLRPSGRWQVSNYFANDCCIHTSTPRVAF